MAAKHQQSRNINVNIQQLSNVIRSSSFSNQLNLKWVSENPAPSGVWFWFHHGMSFSSYGEKVIITLTPISNAATKVDIHSECSVPTQIVDWGKNKQVVNSIYDFLLSASAHFTPPQPVQAPLGFCTKCGKKITEKTNFCSACGAKLR